MLNYFTPYSAVTINNQSFTGSSYSPYGNQYDPYFSPMSVPRWDVYGATHQPVTNGYMPPAYMNNTVPVPDTNTNSIIWNLRQKNAEFCRMAQNIGYRYNNVQSRINEKQEWLENQGPFKRFINGINGKTRRAEREVSFYNRELVGIQSDAIALTNYRVDTFMSTIVQLAAENERLREQCNRQNYIYNEMFKSIGHRLP